MLRLADRVATRLRAKSLAGRTITARVRFAYMRAVTRSATLETPTSATMAIAEIATELIRTALADHPLEKVITLLAVSVSHLRTQPETQLDLPLGLPDERRRPGARPGIVRWSADRAMDAIRARFGRDAIGYAAAALNGERSVPDAFRKLTERELGGHQDD